MKILNSQKGLSIIAVVTTLMVLALLAAVATSLLSTRSNISSREVGSQRALYIAEAGLAVTKHTLGNDWSSYNNPANFPTTSFAGGTYEVTIDAGAEPNDHVTVTVAGTYNESRRTINVVVNRFTPPALDSAIHSNGNVNLIGNAAIDGDIRYTDDYSAGGSSTVTGDVIQDDTAIPTLNVDAARTAALANLLNGFNARADHNYFRGNFAYNPTSLNGIIFVDTFNDGSPANVQISGNIETTDGNPAMLVVMGNLKITGNVSFNGLVYTSGATEVDITLAGTMSIDGALITSGNVRVQGNANITYNRDMLVNDIIEPLLEGLETPYEEGWKEIQPN